MLASQSSLSTVRTVDAICASESPLLPGTGKSVLLREIIKVLRKRYSKAGDAVAVTASTGIAACNIGGVTIHSFAGIGIGIDEAEQLATRIRKNRKAMSRWQRTKVLIIDEGVFLVLSASCYEKRWYGTY